MMATNLGIDEKLLNEAQKLGGLKTKKATVNEALREYVRRRRQLEAIELFGTIDFDPEYDYKRERRRKRGGGN
jgi:Arc/MetJ family transcription regulator